MDLNWWKESKGVKTNNADEFQDFVEDVGPETFIVVDFFMPACHYCVEFMPTWNKIVDEFTAEYGDQIKFVKVDGMQDGWTADRYNVESFPTFVILQPGTLGDQYSMWRPMVRDYRGMKTWIKKFAGDKLKQKNAPIPAAKTAPKKEPVVDQKPVVLPAPVVP